MDISKEIPPDVNWILRVDGHADRQKVQSDRYPSNWELSAARAITVVKLLIASGRAGGPAGGDRVRRQPAARSRGHAGRLREEPPHRDAADRPLAPTATMTDRSVAPLPARGGGEQRKREQQLSHSPCGKRVRANVINCVTWYNTWR